MPHDANTLNVCGEMMSGWQDSFMLKLALQPVGNWSSLILVADQSAIYCLFLYVPVNRHGHVGTISSPNHTFFLGKLD